MCCAHRTMYMRKRFPVWQWNRTYVWATNCIPILTVASNICSPRNYYVIPIAHETMSGNRMLF